MRGLLISGSASLAAMVRWFGSDTYSRNKYTVLENRPDNVDCVTMDLNEANGANVVTKK